MMIFLSIFFHFYQKIKLLLHKLLVKIRTDEMTTEEVVAKPTPSAPLVIISKITTNH